MLRMGFIAMLEPPPGKALPRSKASKSAMHHASAIMG
jgi:hypothetical protein